MYNIFCVWSGNNPMSITRQKSLQSIIDNSGCKITLVTPENISTIEKKDNPIHEAYKYLSLTHKADYLRAYLMYYYGGGYSDIKQIDFNWKPYFDLLENSSFDFIGYAERLPRHIASNKQEIQNFYSNLCGCGHFIFKPKSSFAAKWLNQVNSILDYKFDQLKQHPGTYHPRAIFGGIHDPESTNVYSESRYPLEWNEILGKIIHELMYQNFGCYTAGMPYPNISFYR